MRTAKLSGFRRSLKLEADTQLRNLRDLLNDYPHAELREAFRGLVSRWVSAPDLQYMLARDRALWDALSKAWKPSFEPSASGKGAVWTINQIPVRVGQSYEYLPAENLSTATPERWAIRHFALLVLNPLCHHLHNPCEGCKRYFIQKRSTKSYCTKGCGKRCRKEQATAAERGALLKTAAKVWPRWTEAKHPKRSVWVAERINGSHVRVKTKTGWKPAKIITGKWVSRNAVKIQKEVVQSQVQAGPRS